ncbi:MAG: tripartite tricarboxylate transporter substrate binding protein [Treponema sp.]|nr:tripartite tricarboxylate transporter substrate binding protein [Treponema sp.]
MKNLKSIILCLVLALTLTVGVFAGGSRQTDDYANFPTRPVTVIVPWAMGGASDLLFRTVANYFPLYANGQTMIVRNVEGASSVVGVTEFMGVRPDGYTIAMWATAQTIRTHMASVPYEATDFRPLFASVDDSPYILVHRDSPFQTVNDLVAFARANPGRLTLGNSGAGGGNHLAALQFCIAAGIDVNHIPFGGGGPSAQATLAREIDASVNVPAEGLLNVDAGDLRMLVVIGDRRMARYPNVPTTVEMGINAINRQTRGAVIHKDTPEGIVRRYEEIFRQIALNPDFQNDLRQLSMNPIYATGAEYERMIIEESELYRNIIQSNRLGDRY